jgi:hypothetical protein
MQAYSYSQCTTLVEGVKNRAGCTHIAQRMYRNSALSAQFFYDCKTALKKHLAGYKDLLL